MIRVISFFLYFFIMGLCCEIVYAFDLRDVNRVELSTLLTQSDLIVVGTVVDRSRDKDNTPFKLTNIGKIV